MFGPGLFLGSVPSRHLGLLCSRRLELCCEVLSLDKYVPALALEVESLPMLALRCGRLCPPPLC